MLKIGPMIELTGVSKKRLCRPQKQCTVYTLKPYLCTFLLKMSWHSNASSSLQNQRARTDSNLAQASLAANRKANEMVTLREERKQPAGRLRRRVNFRQTL